jgi:hypothetical protein
MSAALTAEADRPTMAVVNGRMVNEVSNLLDRNRAMSAAFIFAFEPVAAAQARQEVDA